MPSNVLPSEDCVFRLDSRDGWKQPFDVTFVDVGLTDDGFEFDTSVITVDKSAKTDVHGDTSYEFMFKSDIPSANSFILSNYNATTSGALMYIDTSGKFTFDGRDGSGSYRSVKSNTIVGNNSIVHVICMLTIDGIWSIYVNGTFDNSLDTSYSPSSLVNSTDITIGAFDANYFSGTIEHVSIYQRALTSTEVKDRYKERTFRVE